VDNDQAWKASGLAARCSSKTPRRYFDDRIHRPLAGAVSGEPFSISYAALMAASDASDPDGDAISFRVETVTSGVLTMNGEPVTPGKHC
jgi:hypothetical protein